MPGLPPAIADNSVVLTWRSPATGYYGYCTLADVEFEFVDIDSYTSLTASAVGQEITNAAVEIQELLEHLYVMPYTGTDGGILATLRDINAKLAAANLIDRYFAGSLPNDSSAGVGLRRFAEAIIVDIRTTNIRWDAQVGGDAQPQVTMPVYDKARLAQIYPPPDSQSNTPRFLIGRSKFRDDVM